MTATDHTTLAPTELRGAYEAIADTSGPVQLRGAGTAADWAGRPEPAPTRLDTSGMTGVLAYNPADMTIAVRAGTPLAEVQHTVAEHGQRVAFDAARAARGATVGGLVATADSGPLALAHGSLRDLVIGATVVLADGTVARTGGHVIKNVAGYDLAKLLHGSYGAFGLLAEIVLRLHPIPAASRTVRLDAELATAAARTADVLAGALEPVSLEWAEGTLLARVEGTVAGADARAAELARLVGGSVLAEDVATAAWARHAELVGDAAVRIGCRPSTLPGVLAECAESAVAGLGTGIATVSVARHGVERVHDVVADVGGTSVTRRRATGTRAWGAPPSALSVLTRVKRELDPDDRFGRGRFDDWFAENGTDSEEANA